MEMNRNDILSFVSKIITTSADAGEIAVKQNIEKFKQYLSTVKFVSDNMIKTIEKIEECIPELIQVYKKSNRLDSGALQTFIFPEKDEKINDNDHVKQLININRKRAMAMSYGLILNDYGYRDDYSYSSSCGGGSGSGGGSSC